MGVKLATVDFTTKEPASSKDVFKEMSRPEGFLVFRENREHPEYAQHFLVLLRYMQWSHC